MADAGFLPGRHPIDAYGGGGFRFGEMSHRGSLLLVPGGVHAWSATRPEEIDQRSLHQVFAEASAIELLLIGTGVDPAFLSPSLLASIRRAGPRVDAMPTAAAARTYNVLLAENRRVAAALIAVA